MMRPVLQTKLCIFRTSNGCGWGVKTLEPIKRGTFVADYVGEVITSEEAEERGKKYDAEGRTYLFDLDFNMGQDNPYTVDAAFHGNVAHFINHSCDPNLSIFNVWVDCLDPNLPRICLFSRRDIAKGEQLTFDYCQQSTQNYAFEDVQKADQEGDVVRRAGEETGAPQKMECRCGADNCRKRLFE
ncbi:histone-lysine N-methyltransferase SUV39H1-A-like [Tigriopus californicus]|uniref:histone-lysine N-methyltransferase SUV39H1-A-like n=1 Tax=Tigriopus californicus TaxID=6832 RepID=UPI0027DA4BAC|nr:histone-lysine N-methyltransferase SUV39H1-A-like [Tigriopus californicus]